MIRFTDKEKEHMTEAIRYYIHEATHNSETGIAGLDTDSEQYKVLVNALKKLGR